MFSGLEKVNITDYTFYRDFSYQKLIYLSINIMNIILVITQWVLIINEILFILMQNPSSIPLKYFIVIQKLYSFHTPYGISLVLKIDYIIESIMFYIKQQIQLY